MKLQVSRLDWFLNQSTNFSVLLVTVFGIAAMLPVYFWGMPAGADFDNHYRFALPFYDEIINGNYAPGWLNESNEGFGDARFRFYPPNLYYLLCLFRFLTGNWYAATLVVFTLFSVIGALGVYFWTRRTLSDQTAIFAALIFTVIPYHLTEFYQASLLAEYAATALLPFVFMFVERLMANSDEPKNFSNKLFAVTGLAAVYALIITTHLPTTVISSFSLCLYALFLTDWKTNKKALLFCASGIALGLILSSWYSVKMLSELEWIQAGIKVSSTYYDYRNNFVFSPFSLNNLNTWYGSLLAALTVAIFLPALFVMRQVFAKRLNDADKSVVSKYFAAEQKDFRCKKRLAATLTVALISFLMTTDLSRPLWSIVPKLKDVQFPYRWLAITSVLICPMVALSLQIWRERIKQKKIRPFHLPLLLIFGIALFVTAQDLVFDTVYLSRETFLQRIEEVRGGRSFNDWLPRSASEIKDLSPLAGKVDAGGRQVSIINWESHRRTFSVEAGEEGRARLRSYYYPLWQAFIIKDGGKIQTATAQAADGTLLVEIPPDAVTVEIDFSEPPRTRFSFIIALLGWTMTLSLLIISFYKKGFKV